MNKKTSRYAVSALLFVLASAGGMWLLAGPEAEALSLKSHFFKLYDLTESRGRVVKTAFAYYPDKPELRVRVTLSGGRQANGIYSQPEPIRSLLDLLRPQPPNLAAVFDSDDNHLIALYRE